MIYLFLFLEQSNERGGDSDLLTIHPPEITSTATTNTNTTLNESSDVTSGIIAASMNNASERLKSSFYEVIQNYFSPLFGLNTKDLYNYSHHHSHRNHQNIIYPDHNHPSRKYLQATSSLYSDADMTKDSKSSRNIFSEAFQKSLFEVWLKLPQSDDHMVELDAFTVIALFENIGVVLSYNTALHCLNYIRDSMNALNRYGFKDVLKWYQLYGVDMNNDDDNDGHEVYKGSSHGNRKDNAWLSYKHYLKSIYDLVHSIYQRSIDFMKYQYSVLEKIDMLDSHKERHILKYHNYMKPKSMNGNQGGTVVLLQDSNYLTKLLDFQNQSRVKPSILQCTYYFNHPEITVVKALSTNTLATAASNRAVTSKNSSGGRVGSPDRSGSRNNSSIKILSGKNNVEDDEDEEDDYSIKHHGNDANDDDDGNKRMNGGDKRDKTPGTANRAFREENDPYVYEHEGEIADNDDDDNNDDDDDL